MNKNILLLQLYVVVVAFTAVLGRLIELPAPMLVFWRTLMAGAIMYVWLRLTRRAPLTIPSHQTQQALGVGILIGLHWITFYGSIKLANISVCLAGFASVSFFTSLIEPLILRSKHRISEILLGLIVIPGLILIADASVDHMAGFICSLVSSFLAALFTTCNRRLALTGIKPETITLYEMIGATGTCLLAALILQPDTITTLPTPSDWLWLFILAGICTVWAVSIHIHLLKFFTAFTTNLALNFEPVYGILLAALIFHEHEQMTLPFYLGAASIIAANVVHALLSKHASKG